MAAPKCRIDVWQPTIANVLTTGAATTAQRPPMWVKCDTVTDVTTEDPPGPNLNLRRANACVSVEIKDEMFSPRIAYISIANRPQDFRAFDDETLETQHQDSDGNSIALTAGGSAVKSRIRRNWGPFSHFFREFQQIRIVDLETHMVLFSGRVSKISKKHDGQRGATVELVCKDALEELINIPMKTLPKEVHFPANSYRSTIIQGMLNLGFNYEASLPAGGSSQNQTSPVTTPLATGNIASNDFNASTTAGTSGDVANSYSRFERSMTKPTGSNPIKLKPRKTGSKNLLTEIARWAILEPHEDETAENQFGYDFFVDSNIGSDNLLATTAPPPAMFNYFKRGNRLSAYNSAGQDADTYGLTCILPTLARVTHVGISQRNVGTTAGTGDASTTTFLVATGHELYPGQVITIGTEQMLVLFVSPNPSTETATVVRGWSGTTAASFDTSVIIKENRPASAIMQKDSSSFDDTKDDMFTECALTYDTSYFEGNTKVGTKEETRHFEIMFATEISGDFAWSGKDFDDLSAPANADTPGTDSAELVAAYRADGSTLIANTVARIQYQSTSTVTGATNFGYIMLSHIQSTFPTTNYTGDGGSTYEDYIVLKGLTSNATCRVNLNAIDAQTGRPATVFSEGTTRYRRVFSMTAETLDNIDAIRQEVAARLGQSVIAMKQGDFTVSKAPYYWADFVVRTVAADGSTGQTLTVQSENGTSAVAVTNYGFREGMLVHKRSDDYSTIATHNNKDLYGYCYSMDSDTLFKVNLTEGQSFAADDKIRLHIPIRAGDVMFVDHILANTYGEHLVTGVNFNEMPVPTTSYSTIGENEPRIRIRVGSVHKQSIWNRIAHDRLEATERERPNLPVGTQTFSFSGTWSYPANNIVQWTAGDLRTSDGDVYQIVSSNTSDTTYGLGATGMTGSNKYVVYLEAEGENPSTNAYHFKTIISTSYLENDTNIIIFTSSIGAIAGKANAVAGPNMDLTTTDIPKWEAFVFAHDESVTADLVKAATLTGDKLVNNTITVTQIGDNAISTAKIQTNAITANEIVANAVTTNKIVAGAIIADRIDANAVTADKIEAGAVIAEKLTSNALDSHTITLTGGGKLITSAGAVRAANGAHELSTGFTSPTTGLLIDRYGILGATGTGASNVEFYLSAADGKAYFGGGVCTVGKLGVFFPNTATQVGGTIQWGHSSGGGVTGFYKNTGDNTLTLNAFGGDAVGSSNAFIVKTWIGTATAGTRVPQIHVDNIQCHGTATGFGGGGGGTVTSVDTTVPILGGEITGSGTISHSNAAGYKHIPGGGSSTQVLTYVAPGTATWQAASVHGTHGGGNTFTDGISMTGSNFLLLGSGVVLYTNTPPQFVTGAFIKEMGTPPSTPSSGYGIVYAKTDSKLYFKSDGGTEYDLTGGGGSASFPLLAPDGSGGAPSYSFSDDTNTGMFSLATDKATLVGNGQYCVTADGTSGGGRVGIGSITSPSHVLEISGQGRSTHAAWATSSDERVKENIIDIEPSLDTVLQLKPKRFNFMGSYRPIHEESEVGFIAQEVKEVVPTAITVVEESYGWKQNEEGIWEVDEDNQTIINDFEVLDTSWLFPMLVKAVQELKEQNDGLLARIEALEGN